MYACTKTTGDSTAAPKPPDILNKKNWIANATQEIASILEKVYEDRNAYKEVNAAIYSGYYEDERVVLADLLSPSTSALYYSPKFKATGCDTGIFRKKFLAVLNKGNYPLCKSQLLTPSAYVPPNALLVSDNFRVLTDSAGMITDITGLAIYFPYSENFISTNKDETITNKLDLIKAATIVSTDRDADSGPGRKPGYCTSGINSICYVDAIVDDSFAVNNPTHIVSVGAKVAELAPAEPAIGPSMVRVYHGWSKLTKQMDKLISLTGNGGGSEIKVARISGYLKFVDQQVTNFTGDIVTIAYSRADIRNKKWKRVFSSWDPNWDKTNLEQVYAVYEDDTQGTKTLSGNISTSVNLPGKPSSGKVTGEIGFKVEVMTQDEIITQRKLDRASFLRDGLFNQGWGSISDANDFLPLTKDWPIYDGGTVWQYTMAWKSY